jgi:CBS domain containing-hemolysin-like protein
MVTYILAVVFLLLAILGIVLRKTYFALPLIELKRRARNRNKAAIRMYKAASYGSSLKALLWLYTGLTAALSIVLLARELPIWLSIIIVGPILWIIFSLLPTGPISGIGIWLTEMATPPVAWVLNYLHPSLSRGADAVETYKAPLHTGLFEREDLLKLIELQASQPDSRISAEELDIVKRALQFDTYHVKDILTPINKLKAVSADDVIGPVLIDELHKRGQPYALVREDKKGPIVGILAYEKLGISSQGRVRDHMDKAIYFLNEDDNLSNALHAFFITNQSLFVVIDKSEKQLGIVSIKTILKQLLGHVPGEDFDQYTDSHAVATRHQKSTPKISVDDKQSVNTEA